MDVAAYWQRLKKLGLTALATHSKRHAKYFLIIHYAQYAWLKPVAAVFQLQYSQCC
ncbi:hypothetical protein TELCIR_10964 [Teladorsagia circumcincta]|uniref:Uncharacterized protein n=1 Tax=Teladorsagia circumcincta TaxID=45464 RepID=A0A2G9UAP2_TELCI|nr:hypothetical protein TELCIR_10964 [Teladorsagia circumcincta]